MFDGVGADKGEQLVSGGAIGPRGKQGEYHVDRQRREHQVLGVFRGEQVVRKPQRQLRVLRK